MQKQVHNSLTDTPTEQAILLSQSTSHTGAHLMQPSSQAYEIEDRCFRVSVARRMMLPHPAAANPADVVQFCPDKKCGGCHLQQTSGPESITAMAVGLEEVLVTCNCWEMPCGRHSIS